MNQPRSFPKVASDMFIVQGIWASYFLGVLLIIQIVNMVTTYLNADGMDTYFVASFIASNIFMLVIGIISAVSFLPHYVSNGVTRRDYFNGTIVGTIGIALCIPIVSIAITGIMNLLNHLLNLQVNFNAFENQYESEGQIVADIITSVIFSPHIEFSSNWLLSIFVFALNIFTYYVAGWLIGAAFCRLGLIAGILSIAIGFFVIQSEDILLSASLGLNVPRFVGDVEIPFFASVICVFIIVAFSLWLIRQLTKKMIVKL